MNGSEMLTVTPWRNPESIVLSETSHTQKENSCVTHSCEEAQVHRERQQTVAAGPGGAWS